MEREAPKIVLGGSLAEVVCGAGTIVLAILGLTGFDAARAHL